MLGLFITAIAFAIATYVLRSKFHLRAPAMIGLLALLGLLLFGAGVTHAGGCGGHCAQVVQQVAVPYYQNVVQPIVLPTTQYLVQPQQVMVQRQAIAYPQQVVVAQNKAAIVTGGRTRIVQRRQVSRVKGASAAVVVGGY